MGKIIYEYLEDPNLSKSTSSTNLSILIGVDRFSFLIADQQQNVIALKSYNYHQPISKNYSLATGIKDICRSDPFLTLAFQSIKIGLINSKNTLVPESLFLPEQLGTYLSNVLDFPTDDRLRADQLKVLGNRNIYSNNAEVMTTLENFFPGANIFHNQTATLLGFHKLAALQSGHQLFINVHEKQVHVLAFVGKDLLFSNVFPFESSNDFIYYVLLVYDQFKLKPDIVPLTIAGLIIKDSEIYHLLYRYIRLLNMVQAPDYYRFADNMRREQDLHFYFDLYSLKLCE